MQPDLATLTQERNRVLAALPKNFDPATSSVCLFGAGFVGLWAADYLKARGFRLKAFVDSNPDRTGSIIKDLPVIAPAALSELEPDLIFITARHAIAAVSKLLAAQSLPHVSLDAWYVAENFAQFIAIHDDILEDERSKETLRAVMLAMLTGKTAPLHAVYERDQYFCLPQFCGGGQEIYVDAGAFVGDSLERFLWAQSGAFAKAYAFEPGAKQFAAMQQRMQRLKAEWAMPEGAITLENSGLGASSLTLSASTSSGQLQSLSLDCSGEHQTQIVALDDYLAGRPITFLKADVEGMEMALLQGAMQTLQRCKPKLAICTYHYPCDLSEITLFLKTHVPDYRFALRHHAPHLMETVLYAWIDEA